MNGTEKQVPPTLSKKSVLAYCNNPNIKSYEQWQEVIKKEKGVEMTVDEIVQFFAMEREMEDNLLTLKHCGRWP
ncbi:MAG: hypothetical protein EHM93_19790 [Bacteroidales bacterium]|nr:MAG: hypothetical protein EHM93_19790 [Bacteroidales bacterium]